MVNINKIQTGLLKIVGYQQPYNPKYAIVDVDNLESQSGYYITDNPYAKIEFIKDNQDYYNIDTLQFNELLSSLKKRSISNVVNQVFSEYDFIDRSVVYKNVKRKTEAEILPNGFVGFRIKISSNKNVAFKINRVLLDFIGTGTIKLIVWNSWSKTAVYTKEIAITLDHQSENLEWVFDNSENTYKGDYYIGYLTDGITVQPYKNDCLKSQFKNLGLEEIKVVGHSVETLFDLDLTEGLSEKTGLNFDISLYDDYTDFILNNKMLFARAIQLQCTISCIQIYMASLRSNSNQSHANQVYEKIMIELEGTRADNVIYIKGIKNQLLSEISSIRAEIQKLKIGINKTKQLLVSTLE